MPPRFFGCDAPMLTLPQFDPVLSASQPPFGFTLLLCPPGRINARSPEVNGPIHTFPAVATNRYEEQVFFKEQRRELRFKFGSNTVGGDYQMGQIIAHIEAADGRYQS